ncbi:DUF423 domain-containing protein [Veronia pacifica]|uniref:DUF423 domain-containing protein n=1 Tax=Veronia pacifica TaxID=1080227 RepID=A0A1C3EI56_9GAMM|nr:DUF423 domain-containing protein [Veronia pacifica]ODA32918.1 hypothetical protein A8L45_12345 [Veronia pacifica]
MNANKTLAIGCILGALAVMTGAFASHGLKAHLSSYALSIIHTGVQYQFWHALALVGLGSAMLRFPSRRLGRASLLMIIGTIFFSGSLYGLAITGMKWLGPVTPIGGVLLILGWFTAAWSFWRPDTDSVKA